MQIALLIVAGIVLIAAFAVRTTKPEWAAASWGLFAVGVLVAVAAVIVPRFASPDVTIAIVAPEEGATVAAGDPVRIDVNVTGAEVAESPTDLTAGHIHVYVDGDLELMPSATTAMVNLSPGTHEITVEYVDENHFELDPPVRATVQVTAERDANP